MAQGQGDERSSLQRQARALGDPTRYRIFCYVAQSREPVRIAAMTAHFGVNHNAIRQHLAKLCDAGLLVEEPAVHRVGGRPPLEYRLEPSAAGRWETDGPYQQLTLLLLEMQSTGRSACEVGAAAGRRVPVSAASVGPIDRLEAEMARRGFQPRRKERGSTTEIVLDRCPFAAAAAQDPDVVCELHRGLAEGILEAVGGQVELIRLVRHDPKRAGCRLVTRPDPT
jgi:predicted ArsR family transcriptional regulator